MRSAVFVLSVVPLFVGTCLALPEYCPDQKEQKSCLLRTQYYDHQLWKYWSGFYCYNFTNPARLYFKYHVAPFYITCRRKKHPIPVAQIDTTIAFYDYTNETSMALIEKSFKTTTAFNIYKKCCEEAMDCCNNHMTNEIIAPNSTHCPAVWDGWSCFQPVPVETTARLPCSGQAYNSQDEVCLLESEKKCFWNSTTKLAEWVEQTDYTTCPIAPVYERRHKYHIISLAVCTIWCLPAIIIFLSFQKLRKTIRVILHRNLLIAICIRNLLTILSKEVVILDALKSAAESNDVMENNGYGCRILAFFDNSAKNALYACMLLDGFYLHKVIVRTFAREIKIYIFYIALAALAFLPSCLWATCMAVIKAKSCWMVDVHGLQWIVDAFRIAVLGINIILLLDIVRVMLLKLKRKSTTKQTMAAFRATLFLFPLFGIHILITANKIVYDKTCTAEDVYDYARYTMEAIQGILVAVLFCYANSEVHEELGNGWRKFAIDIEQKFGLNLRPETVNRRRTTAMTYVNPDELRLRY